MRIILLGPPGAGKGTQAKDLAKELSLSHISTGDLLRQNVEEKTELGKAAVEFMHQGALVPDGLVNQMLKRRLTQADTQKGFILDGYPRNIRQAEALDDLLKAQQNKQVDFVFYLDASEPVIIQRLSGRLVCSKCGLNFHLKNMPPKKDMLCDRCGSNLYQRPDDQEKTIKKRLEVYRQEVSGLLQYYQQGNKLYSILADGDARVVLKKIMQLIEQHDDSSKV